MACNRVSTFLISFTTTLLFAILAGAQDQELGPISSDDDIAAAAPALIRLPEDMDVGFLNTCAESLIITPECGSEVYKSLLTSEFAVGEGCCVQLYYMGMVCHDAFVTAALELPGNKDKTAAVVPKSELLWEICSNSVASDFGRGPAPGIDFDGGIGEDLEPSSFYDDEDPGHFAVDEPF